MRIWPDLKHALAAAILTSAASADSRCSQGVQFVAPLPATLVPEQVTVRLALPPEIPLSCEFCVLINGQTSVCAGPGQMASGIQITLAQPGYHHLRLLTRNTARFRGRPLLELGERWVHCIPTLKEEEGARFLPVMFHIPVGSQVVPLSFSQLDNTTALASQYTSRLRLKSQPGEPSGRIVSDMRIWMETELLYRELETMRNSFFDLHNFWRGLDGRFDEFTMEYSIDLAFLASEDEGLLRALLPNATRVVRSAAADVPGFALPQHYLVNLVWMLRLYGVPPKAASPRPPTTANTSPQASAEESDEDDPEEDDSDYEDDSDDELEDGQEDGDSAGSVDASDGSQGQAGLPWGPGPELVEEAKRAVWQSIRGNFTARPPPAAPRTPPETLHVFTAADKMFGGLSTLNDSAVSLGWHLHVVGLGRPFEGKGAKVPLMLEVVEKLPEGDAVLFVDAFDVMLLPAADQLLDRFTALGADIVFGAELDCVPDVGLKYIYPPELVRQRAFLNSGTVMGRAGHMREMLQEVQQDLRLHYETHGGNSVRQGHDQRWFTRYFLRHPGHVALDVEQELFLVLWGRPDSDIIVSRNHPHLLTYRPTGKAPCVVHSNGGGVGRRRLRSLAGRLILHGWPTPDGPGPRLPVAAVGEL